MSLEKNQTENVRKKIIFVFFAISIALLLAFVISRTAFSDMLDRLEKITSPDPKMELVQQITKEMLQSRSSVSNQNFPIVSTSILTSLDSLSLLYYDNQMQLTRIDSIRQLISKRDSLYSAYMMVHERLVQNPTLNNQLQSLERIIDQYSADSMIRSTETQKVATTIINPEKTDNKDNRSFFAKIFGIRKSSDNNETSDKRIVKEETNVKTDTITTDHVAANQKLGEVVQQIQSDNSLQRRQLVSRESALTQAEVNLTNHILIILQSVEQEAYQQSFRNQIDAKEVVSDSVNRIRLIFIIFLLVIAVMIFFILSDIRKHNKYRQALEDAKEAAEQHANAKQRFLSNMSHELRTPLQSIIGFTEQLHTKDESEMGVVKAINQSTAHLLQIVNEILDYSRINAGKIILNSEPVDLIEITNSMMEIMRPLADQKNLKLQHQVNIITTQQFDSDPFRIRQILFNLLSNAIKFTDSGAVTLEVFTQEIQRKKSAMKLCILVHDTGIGISDEAKERIFDHFEQADFNNGRIQQGSGLGLSIVKAVCENMGGFIRVRSELGKGSTFEVEIPLKLSKTSETESTNEKLLREASKFDGKIWLVDDDVLILNLCERILDKHGIPFRSFSSPEDLLAEPIEDELSAVLMDIRMPGMDGFQLNKALKAKLDDRAVKLFAFTAQALPEEQHVIRNHGFDDILLKPFREKELLHLLGVRENDRPSALRANGQHQDAVHLNDPKIIQLFLADTQADLALLIQHRENPALQSEVAHKLSGRIGQFGHAKLAFKLRKLEIDLRNIGEHEEIDVTDLIDEVDRYMDEVKERLIL